MKNAKFAGVQRLLSAVFAATVALTSVQIPVYATPQTQAAEQTSQLVNIDGAGNRVACLIHGPKQVIIVVGMNKIVRSIEDGIDRIQTQACPIIADATGRKTPCGVKGVCMDCQSPDCMCCSIVVTRRSRYDGRIKVVIVGENLGY